MFYLFDDDKSGSLDFREIKKIIEIINHQDLNKTGYLSDKINKELENKPPYLDVSDFQKWTRSRPMLTNPVLNLQLKLQEELIGASFWKTATYNRNANEEQSKPGFVFNVIARAEAVYSLRQSKSAAIQKINIMKGSIQQQASSIRPSDEKTQRRNSLVLGLMNLKNTATQQRSKRTAAQFDSEKYRDKNDIKFDDERRSNKKGGAAAIVPKGGNRQALMQEEEKIFVESVDGVASSAKQKPDTSSSKKKSRQTMVAAGGGLATEGQSRKTLIDVSSSGNNRDQNGTNKSSRMSRQTMVASSGGIVLPPIKK